MPWRLFPLLTCVHLCLALRGPRRHQGGSAVDSFDAGMLQSVLSGVGQQMQVDDTDAAEGDAEDKKEGDKAADAAAEGGDAGDKPEDKMDEA